MKIDFTKPAASTKNTFAKQSSGADKNSFAADGGGEGAHSENVDGSDFASVLDNLKNKDREANKAESNKTDSKTNERAEKSVDKSPERAAKDQSRMRSTDNKTVGENAAAAASARTAAGEITAVEPELSVPPARAIMHIADVERIVSSLRVTQLDGGQNQLVITLKNSVFNGLQIKLTTDENRRVTAEFVAASEKVKAQIDRRSDELSELLKRRGVNLTDLKTTVDAGTSGGGQNRQRGEVYEVSPVTAANGVDAAEAVEPTPEVNEVSGHTYRV